MDKQFRALADPTRRDILRLLRDGPLTSGAIDESEMGHIRLSREADLVVAERDGQAIRYELNTSVFQDVLRHLADWVQPTRVPSRRRPRAREQRA